GGAVDAGAAELLDRPLLPDLLHLRLVGGLVPGELLVIDVAKPLEVRDDRIDRGGAVLATAELDAQLVFALHATTEEAHGMVEGLLLHLPFLDLLPQNHVDRHPFAQAEAGHDVDVAAEGKLTI